MKKKSSLLIVVAVIASLAIGFLIGISVDYPRIKLGDVSGTIGKVDNYRNSKATEKDIQLKNDLMADTASQKALLQYLNFYYVRAVNMESNIDFALQEAKNNEAFGSNNGQSVDALASYSDFLKTSRKNLLIAVANCKVGEKVDAAKLRESLKQANNVIAQMNYRNNTVVGFIDDINSFLSEKGVKDNAGLVKAHDLLTLNEVTSALITKDKALQRFLEGQKLYGNDLKSPNAATCNDAVKQDMEQLHQWDAEQLGMYCDSETLGQVFDTEQFGAYSDFEKLGVFDTEKLGRVFDSEKLGGYILDMEKLGGSFIRDMEELGGSFIRDMEELGGSFPRDMEVLGSMWM